MADILIHSTVPSLCTPTESISNFIVDTPTKDSHSTNKYNGHVTRLRNVFTEQSLISNDQPTDFRTKKFMTNHRQEHIPIQLTDTLSYNENIPYAILNRKYSNSESHYDFPADAIEQLKKQQHHNENDQIITRIIPSFLPSNVLKRMNHVNTIFVKPTRIERSFPKLVFEDDDKRKKSKSIESPIFNEADYFQDDIDRSSSPIFYEKSGLPKLDDDNDDDSLNDARRVRFSTAPIRVYPTYSPGEYDRRNADIDPYSASAEYELEKRIEKMDVFNIEIEKGPDGLGISVLGMGVGADSGLEKLGIFVKTLNPEGVIAKDGRIKIGDQIIEVDDHSLIGVTHLYATNVLKNTSGFVKFLIGREKDLENSEILGLIQRSLQLDQERDEMSQTFQQYHDAYYERDFNDDDGMKDDEENLTEQKLSNAFQIEILKQCYESLEKTLEKTEKEKEHYQQLYEQILKDYKQIEEKYFEAKILIKELEDREIEPNEQREKRVNELMKRIEELEKIIASSSSSKSIECIVNRDPVLTSAARVPSISSDKLSINSQRESWQINTNIPQQNLVSNNDKSVYQNLLMNKTKLPSKHLSTPSLGQISNDSDFISVKSHISRVPSLEQTNNNAYVEIKDWTQDQCIQWLTAQQMTSLIPIFLNRTIDGEKLLLLDSAKIKAMGIKSSKDRDQLKAKIKELKQAELNRLREQLLHQPSSSSVHSGKRLRSSSLTKLKERRFFSSSGGK